MLGLRWICLTEFYESGSLQGAIQFLMTNGRKRPFSIRELSRKLGYSSDRAIGMVHAGQRPMSEEMITRFASHFRLTEKQQSFLRALCEQTRGRSVDLARFRSSSNYVTLSQDQLKALEAWYSLPVLRFVSRLGPFTLGELCERFALPAADIRAALQAHIDLGKIRLDGEHYHAVDPSKFLKTATEIPSRSIREMHRGQLRRADVILDEQSVLDREFVTCTIPVSRSRMTEFKARVREAIIALSDELVAPDSAEDVEIYQLSTQFFRQVR